MKIKINPVKTLTEKTSVKIMERMQHLLDTLFQKRAKKYHLDLNPDNPAAEANFKNIVEAYETLSVSSKRKKYDATLMHSFDTMGANTDTQNTTHNTGAASNINFGNFTKDIKRYFGFSFHISPLFKQCCTRQ